MVVVYFLGFCWLIAGCLCVGSNIAKCSMQEDFVILDMVPSDVISSFVYSDTIGENFCRLTVTNLAILA